MNVRFAPSPTGKMHIGNFRTLMFVYLFSYFNNLKLICRIDDTDILRNNLDSLKNILLVLHVFLINYCSYNQLTKINKCIEYLNLLNDKKLVYRCICTDRKHCNCINKSYNYGSYVLDVKAALNNESKIVYNDNIYGQIEFNTIHDIVIFRSNKMPLYNFISVVCDIEDEISLIVRGCEHITNTWQQRSEKIVSIIDLIKNGYLRSTIKNYVVLLGLNTGDKEYFNVENIIKDFKYKNFHKTNAKYSIDKLTSLNKKHIQSLTRESLIDELQLYLMLNNIDTQNLNLDYLPCNLKRYSLLSQLYYDLICLSGNYYTSNLQENISYLQQKDQLCIFNQIVTYIQKKISIREILNSLSLEFDKKTLHTVFRILTIYVVNGIDSASIRDIIGEEEIIYRILNYKKFIIVHS